MGSGSGDSFAKEEDAALRAAFADRELSGHEVCTARRRGHHRFFGTLGPELNTTVGRYQLQRAVGSGGFATVFAAMDPRLGRMVAIKVLHGRSPVRTTTLLVEGAAAMSRVVHPNVVRVYDVDETSGPSPVSYIAMELIEGPTLRKWQTGRDASAILQAYRGAAQGLAAAHAAGLAHGDFKPGNVLVDSSGHAYVTDFATLVRSNPSRQRCDINAASTACVGTRAYMAPERIAGGPATALADQYALCLALTEALAKPGCPRWVSNALERGLAAEPHDRYPDMAQLLVALQPPRRTRLFILGAVVTLAISWLAGDSPPRPHAIAAGVAGPTQPDATAVIQPREHRNLRHELAAIEARLDSPGLSPRIRAKLTIERGLRQRASGRWAQAVATYQRGGWLAQAAGDKNLVLRAALGEVRASFADDTDLRDLDLRTQRAWALAQAHGTPVQKLHAALFLGRVALALGEPERGLRLELAALSRAQRELGRHHVELCYAHDYVAAAYAAKQQPREALEHKLLAIEALEHHVGPNHVDLIVLLRNTATLMTNLGQRAKARAYLDRASLIAEAKLDRGHVLRRAVAAAMGNWWAAEGDLDRARELLEDSIANDHSQEATHRTLQLAETLLEHGDAHSANDVVARWTDDGELWGRPATRGRWTRTQARIALERNDLRLAQEFAQSALQIALGDNHPNDELRARVARAEVALSCGRHEWLGDDVPRIEQLLAQRHGLPQVLRAQAWAVLATAASYSRSAGFASVRARAVSEVLLAYGPTHPTRVAVEHEL